MARAEPKAEDNLFTTRMLMAAVRKAGGKLVLTEAEVFAAGDFKMEFDPPLLKDTGSRPASQRIILTVEG